MDIYDRSVTLHGLVQCSSSNMDIHSERRTALLLASAQALFQTASVVMVTVGGLVGLQLAPDARMATLGWRAVNMAALPGLLIVALAIGVLGVRRRSSTLAAMS